MSNNQSDSCADNPHERIRLVQGGLDFHGVTEKVASISSGPFPKPWLMLLGLFGTLAALVPLCIGVLVYNGVGVWGLHNGSAWGWDIVNFVFWVGIAHAGTFISSILYLTRQKWRTSIARYAEAITIFAVACAGLFPAIHIGRVWCAHWLFPLPNQMDLWPNFRSPLLWDVVAVNTYATCSLLFWYMGMIPDLATYRDRAKSRIAQIAYGLFSLGWTGSARQWMNFEKAYQIFAAICTPLICAVSGVVSFDFAGSQLPGWHATIFPLYFVCGAVFQGFSATILLLTITRKAYKLDKLITDRHMDNLCKITIGLSFIVTYIYFMEWFIAGYSGNPYETDCFSDRLFGPYGWCYWTMLICNAVVPQLYWFKGVRHSFLIMALCGLLGVIGMWFERFVIIAVTINHTFIPSSWTYYSPSVWEIGLFTGSIGTFCTLMLLFCRFLPIISIAEVKAVMPEANPHHGDKH